MICASCCWHNLINDPIEQWLDLLSLLMRVFRAFNQQCGKRKNIFLLLRRKNSNIEKEWGQHLQNPTCINHLITQDSVMSALRFELSWTCPNLKDLNKYSKTKLNRKDHLKVMSQNFEGLTKLLPSESRAQKIICDAPTGEWDSERNQGFSWLQLGALWLSV